MDSAHKYSFSSVHCEIGRVATLVQLSQITEVMAFAFCTKGEGSINLEGCVVASACVSGSVGLHADSHPFWQPCHAKVTFEGFPGRAAFHYSERAIYIAPKL